MKQKRAKEGKKIPPTPGFEPQVAHAMSSWGHKQALTHDGKTQAYYSKVQPCYPSTSSICQLNHKLKLLGQVNLFIKVAQ